MRFVLITSLSFFLPFFAIFVFWLYRKGAKLYNLPHRMRCKRIFYYQIPSQMPMPIPKMLFLFRMKGKRLYNHIILIWFYYDNWSSINRCIMMIGIATAINTPILNSFSSPPSFFIANNFFSLNSFRLTHLLMTFCFDIKYISWTFHLILFFSFSFSFEWRSDVVEGWSIFHISFPICINKCLDELC